MRSETLGDHLSLAIEQSLAAYLYDNAVFLAERLCAEVPGDNSRHTLGRCLFLRGNVSQAYSVLKGCQDSNSRYLLARCCLGLGKAQEGTEVLQAIERNGLTNHISCPGAIDLLLGEFSRKSNLIEVAGVSYKSALLQNPFLWSACGRLCEMGIDFSPTECFTPNQTAKENLPMRTSTVLPHTPKFVSENIVKQPQPLFETPYNFNESPPVNNVTPMAAPIPSPKYHKKLPPAPARKQRPPTTVSFKRRPTATNSANGPRTRSRKHLLSDSNSDTNEADTSATASAKSKSKPVRTVRPFCVNESRSGSYSSAYPKTKPRAMVNAKGGHTITTSSSTPLDSVTPHTPNRERERGSRIEQQDKGRCDALQLLLSLATAYQTLCSYDSHRAIELFEALPPAHSNTGWVLIMIARAWSELGKYREAEQIYQEARRVAPYIIQGMEIYSTVLWHLRKEKTLSGLAHELMEQDKLAPETWCVVGNCFSVQKEHLSAKKFFERAIQIDPEFTYAYTLLGHEYVYNEDFDKALACFRTAIMMDPRHYNAWYGLGMVFYRQEKYDLAKYHFMKALEINPHNCVLYCYIAMVLHARKYDEEALANLDEGLKFDRQNPLAKYQRAVVLNSLERSEEAICELNELADIAPKEPSVYFLMGKIHRKLGHQDQAVRYLTWARDLDPISSA
eukprot:Ihof_evm3s157 gene=Ihof_evmTU3s157